MRFLTVAAALVALLCAGASRAQEVGGSFISLCYHEVHDDVREHADAYAVDTAALVRQFAWLRDNGYTAITLDDVLKARRGAKPLPAKAVLLTFDDGYLSFYTRVYPLLREFGFPAVLGVVGRWIERRDTPPARYGAEQHAPQASFPTWGQLREMTASGLVEIASHTYDLHHGVIANPQGNSQPAATTRIFDPASGRYESDAAWRARVRADLAENSRLIERETGQRPRAVVWPYGSYNLELVQIAGELGMPIALTLDRGANGAANGPEVPLAAVRRIIMMRNPDLGEYVAQLRAPRHPEHERVIEVDLDGVYDADPARQEAKLSLLLDRVQALRPSHVYLRAFASPAHGVAAAYFPNGHLPVRADLFNRVAWQLGTRSAVQVFALVPASALPQRAAIEVLEDLARHGKFAGVVFDDPDAAATSLIRRAAERMRAFRAPLQIARSLALDERGAAPQLGAWLAQYDYVVVRVNGSRIDNLPLADPVARSKLVVILPAQSSGEALARRLRSLQLAGALRFGYAPDDFLRDAPALAQVAPAMALRMHPTGPPK